MKCYFLWPKTNYKSWQDMDCCFGSLNTKGFQSALSGGSLPEPDHITYEGAFNELNFSIGPKAKEPMELHIGYARAQNSQSQFDNTINDYLAIFTKGNKDGQDRDNRVLNSVVVLDISGSMGSGLTRLGQGCRLQLAKEAIKMFYSKLRPDDSFGLVVFDNNADTVIPMAKKSATNADAIFNLVASIKTRGGTTLMSGFNEGNKILGEFIAVNSENTVKNAVENRIIMLTDVGDNSIKNAKTFVEKVEKSGIHTTVIGVSDDFQSSTCEEMVEIKGFNYFCATEVEDLKKYLFENFSYTFFPANYDIRISIESENIKSIQVFGTVDGKKVNEYNDHFKGKCSNIIVTKTQTSFPSELEIGANGEVKTYGGLIVVKLTLEKELPSFEGKVKVAYRTTQGQEMEKVYDVKYDVPMKEQFYSEESLAEALSAYHYVFEVKNILDVLQKEGSKKYAPYIEPLKKLRDLAPKSKLDQLDKLIKVLEGNPQIKNGFW